MRGGALPPALLFAALGFLLAYAPRKLTPPAVLAMVAGAAGAFAIGVPDNLEEIAFAGCWISVMATALLLHLPGRLGALPLTMVGLNAGVWAGAVISVAGTPLDLVIALPAVLVVVPAALILHTPARVGVKIVGSWLAAVAILAAAIPLTPTAGYEPDHFE